MYKILLILFLIFPLSLSARTKLAFIYPNGEGNTDQIQPYLDQLKVLLLKHGAPLDLEIVYINDDKEGLKKGYERDIDLAIVSTDFFLLYSSVFNELSMFVRMLGSPKDGQYFHLLSHQDNTLPPQIDKIFMTRKVNRSLVDNDFFPDISIKEINSEKGVFSILREIGKNGKKEWVLVDDFEYENIKKLKFDWLKPIRNFKKSQKLPHSVLVIFSNLSDYKKRVMVKSLKKLNKDKEAQELMTTLRIHSFMDLFVMKPDS